MVMKWFLRRFDLRLIFAPDSSAVHFWVLSLTRIATAWAERARSRTTTELRAIFDVYR